MERAHTNLLRSNSDHVNFSGMRGFNKDHAAHKPYTLKERDGPDRKAKNRLYACHCITDNGKRLSCSVATPFMQGKKDQIFNE